MQYSINFKGEQNPKNPLLVKIRMIIYKRPYARVEKLLKVTGNFKDWDNKAQRFKGKSQENSTLNLQLSEIHKQYIQLANQWEAERLSWEPKHLSHYFDNPKNLAPSEKRILTVSQVYDMRIERLMNKRRIVNGVEKSSKAYARKFVYSKRLVEQFVKEEFGRDFSTYYFADIDEAFLTAFAFYIEKKAIENGNQGGMHEKLFCLYKVVDDAKRRNVRGADTEVFECVAGKYRTKETEPKTIPYEDMLRIEHFDRSLLSKEERKWLDMYLFCFYTGGMAPIDSAYIKWSHIDLKRRQAEFERMKTGKIARPPFHPKAEEIAKRYRSECWGDYVLPLLDEKHQSEEQRKNRIVYFEKRVNATLARISEMLGLSEEVKFYSCRGTYITRLIDLGVHPMVVADHCGNSPDMIYKHYWKNTNHEEVNKLVFAGL